MIDQSYRIGDKIFENRLVFQPMESRSCRPDGSPSELTERKYMKAAESGAGTVWFEACAVCPEARTGETQMMLTENSAGAFSSLLAKMKKASGERQIYILQLTHSGRQSASPIIAYHNALYEAKKPVPPGCVATDGYLGSLPALYAKSARLAVEVGFDGVDVKSCHGYLLQELLSAFSREGDYGGCFENRTRLLLDCVRAVRSAIPSDMIVASRLGVSDVVPYPYGFGTDADGNIDYAEPDALISELIRAGVGLINVTVGNPYYNPHVNRPFRKGGYIPPESPRTGLQRFIAVQKHIKEKFPSLPLVCSGMSYYGKNIIEKSQELLRDGVSDLVGFGRMWLAYPEIYRDHLSKAQTRPKYCVTCSRCTELMRGGMPSGCAVYDECYRDLYAKMKENGR